MFSIYFDGLAPLVPLSFCNYQDVNMKFTLEDSWEPTQESYVNWNHGDNANLLQILVQIYSFSGELRWAEVDLRIVIASYIYANNS